MSQTQTKPNSILIFLFYVQFLINFIDENGLHKHPFFRQKLKHTLKVFTEALEEQMNLYVYGTATKPVDMMPMECLDNTHKGVMELEEHFRIAFQLGEIAEEAQSAFLADYNELIKKHGLTKSLEELTVNR